MSRPTSAAQARRIRHPAWHLPKEKAMFPALTYEFLTSENEYRHGRSPHSFLEQSRSRSARARRRRTASATSRAPQPTVDRSASTWSPRSA